VPVVPYPYPTLAPSERLEHGFTPRECMRLKEGNQPNKQSAKHPPGRLCELVTVKLLAESHKREGQDAAQHALRTDGRSQPR
jgi:hypothetical protein